MGTNLFSIKIKIPHIQIETAIPFIDLVKFDRSLTPFQCLGDREFNSHCASQSKDHFFQLEG